ncbi:FprA family A-type flavoprotein [Synergistaceae bacterium OttesenSCG-928-I11]|nr:FprA family A-type flavoprotein [Synergistaceae bacterium OttesenSCG-928-I11]
MFKTHGIVPITDGVYWIGANDRETDKFEGLWELPHGMAYNAYFLDGDKTCLIDTVKSSYMDDFLFRLSRLLGDRPLDYVIVNHMEPDHSGAMELIRRLYPGVKFVGNAKTAEFMKHFYGIEEGVVTVKEGETLDLGSRKLVFAFAPMVHWPESMATYDPDSKILFSNDIFGGFGAVEGRLFDDAADCGWAVSEMMRYYVNIVGRFARPALAALAKVRTLDISMICPSHGPIWRRDPERVIALYEKWSRQETEEGAVVVYGSMYGNTKVAADAIANGLSGNGIKTVQVYDISRANMSYVTTDTWRYRGLVLASCTYNLELYPPMAALLRLYENKNMKGRHIGLCGTYSWAPAALKEMREFVDRSKGGWTLVDPSPEIRSYPTAADIETCELLGKNMAEAIRDK